MRWLGLTLMLVGVLLGCGAVWLAENAHWTVGKYGAVTGLVFGLPIGGVMLLLGCALWIVGTIRSHRRKTDEAE